MSMTNKEKKQLVKLQQGELDAVLMYRKLAEVTRKPKVKETLLKIAADEGKHAAMIRKHTGENLKQKTTLSLVISAISKVIGLNFTLKLIAKAEFMIAGKLTPLVDRFPDIQEIIDDEEMHGKLIRNMLQ